MKITIRKGADGTYEGYIAKKDLEAKVVQSDTPHVWGGLITLDNGWRFEMPDLPPDTRLPLTVEARKLADED